jgi:hypothetical protein
VPLPAGHGAVGALTARMLGAELPDPRARRESEAVGRDAPPGAPALNRDEALELLGQLESALQEVRRLRSHLECDDH